MSSVARTSVLRGNDTLQLPPLNILQSLAIPSTMTEAGTTDKTQSHSEFLSTKSRPDPLVIQIAYSNGNAGPPIRVGLHHLRQRLGMIIATIGE
jgi:hypothetical protein